MGPVLVQQETQEAKSNINKRIEFIKSEIKRQEDLLKKLDAQQEKKKLEIVALQKGMQQQGQNEAAAPVGA